MSALEIPAWPLSFAHLVIGWSRRQAAPRAAVELHLDKTQLDAQNLHNLRTVIKLSAPRHLEKLAYRFCGEVAGVLK